MTYDEIRLLHQPYVDIADAISLEFGVNITIGTIDCYDVTREDILYAISNISLADHESRLRELGEQVSLMTYSSKVVEAVLEFGYDLRILLDALVYGVFDPADVYYRIQQDGVSFFFEEIYEEILPLSITLGVFRNIPFFANGILINDMVAQFCTVRRIFTSVHSTTLQPVGSWSIVASGHHISSFIDGSVAITTNSGVIVRRFVPGGTDMIEFHQLSTNFWISDRIR